MKKDKKKILDAAQAASNVPAQDAKTVALMARIIDLARPFETGKIINAAHREAWAMVLSPATQNQERELLIEKLATDLVNSAVAAGNKLGMFYSDPLRALGLDYVTHTLKVLAYPKRTQNLASERTNAKYNVLKIVEDELFKDIFAFDKFMNPQEVSKTGKTSQFNFSEPNAEYREFVASKTQIKLDMIDERVQMVLGSKDVAAAYARVPEAIKKSGLFDEIVEYTRNRLRDELLTTEEKKEIAVAKGVIRTEAAKIALIGKERIQAAIKDCVTNHSDRLNCAVAAYHWAEEEWDRKHAGDVAQLTNTSLNKRGAGQYENLANDKNAFRAALVEAAMKEYDRKHNVSDLSKVRDELCESGLDEENSKKDKDKKDDAVRAAVEIIDNDARGAKDEKNSNEFIKYYYLQLMKMREQSSKFLGTPKGVVEMQNQDVVPSPVPVPMPQPIIKSNKPARHVNVKTVIAATLVGVLAAVLVFFGAWKDFHKSPDDTNTPSGSSSEPTVTVAPGDTSTPGTSGQQTPTVTPLDLSSAAVKNAILSTVRRTYGGKQVQFNGNTIDVSKNIMLVDVSLNTKKDGTSLDAKFDNGNGDFIIVSVKDSKYPASNDELIDMIKNGNWTITDYVPIASVNQSNVDKDYILDSINKGGALHSGESAKKVYVNGNAVYAVTDQNNLLTVTVPNDTSTYSKDGLNLAVVDALRQGDYTYSMALDVSSVMDDTTLKDIKNRINERYFNGANAEYYTVITDGRAGAGYCATSNVTVIAPDEDMEDVAYVVKFTGKGYVNDNGGNDKQAQQAAGKFAAAAALLSKAGGNYKVPSSFNVDGYDVGSEGLVASNTNTNVASHGNAGNQGATQGGKASGNQGTGSATSDDFLNWGK